MKHIEKKNLHNKKGKVWRQRVFVQGQPEADWRRCAPPQDQARGAPGTIISFMYCTYKVTIYYT